MRLHPRYWLLGVLALGALLLLYARTNRFDFAEHAGFDAQLGDLQTYDTTLNQDLLKVRFRLLGDYDGLSGKLHAMQQTVGTLAAMPAFVPVARQSDFQARLAEFSQLLVQKEQLLESFKSGNAVLNNSLRYLPLAGTDLLGRLAGDEENRGLEKEVNELMQHVLVYCLNPGEDEAPALQQALDKLGAWQSENPACPPAAAVAAHVRSILTRKPKIETLTQSIVMLPTALCIEEMRRLYEVELASVLHAADRSRGWLKAGCALLLLGIGGAFYAVDCAKRNLERRVMERTRDLQGEIAERKLAEAGLLESQRFLQSALDALSAHIGILDEVGRIVSVNGAWSNFAMANSLSGEGYGVGANYLEVCERASGECSTEAAEVARGIRAVIDRQIPEFQLEYPCHSPAEKRWFIVRVTRFRGDGPVRVVVAHENITQRKQAENDLEKMHRELLEVSRQAGMAEVATGVLHNVGNVLNSVNVSATLVMESVKKSKAANLAKLAALLDEHAADLAVFVSGDPRGKQLPAYVRQLSDRVAAEQQGVVKELDALVRNIEHIKDIVSMQQSYGKVSGVTEVLSVTDLVEDSLHLNAAALSRHEVEVVREFQPVPRINIEKHKILQILVNLIHNAKHACDEAGRTDKRVTLRVANGNGTIKIAVSDNGIGIPPENLTRIFNHGFTTKKEGHGFGLHSGALAAQQLGGSLTAHSDGPGHGATFIIELPCQLP